MQRWSGRNHITHYGTLTNGIRVSFESKKQTQHACYIYTQMYRNNYDTMLKTLWLLIMPKTGLKISIQDKDYALISSRTCNV